MVIERGVLPTWPERIRWKAHPFGLLWRVRPPRRTPPDAGPREPSEPGDVDAHTATATTPPFSDGADDGSPQPDASAGKPPVEPCGVRSLDSWMQRRAHSEDRMPRTWPTAPSPAQARRDPGAGWVLYRVIRFIVVRSLSWFD